MKKILVGLLLILGTVILSGCTQQQTKTETSFSGIGYGTLVRLLTQDIITPGSPITITLELKNNGDYQTEIKYVELLGKTTYVDGNTRYNTSLTIFPGSSQVVTFSLTVKQFAGGETLEFYPLVCYSYRTEGRTSVYVTSDYDIYSNMTTSPLESSTSNSPITLSFSAPYPIYLATEVDEGGETYYAAKSVVLEIKPKGKPQSAWPVKDCINNATAKVIRSFNITIHFPKDAYRFVIKNGREFFSSCTNTEQTVGNDIYIDPSTGETTCTVNEKYRTFYRGIGFQSIILQMEYWKDRISRLDQIVVEASMEYDYQEILDMAKARIQVVSTPK